eukprot:gene10458-14047_t
MVVTLFSAYNWTTVSVLPVSSWRCISSNSNNRYITVSYQNGMYNTMDNGTTWNSTFDQLTKYITMTSDGKIQLALSSGIWRSVDHGVSWSLMLSKAYHFTSIASSDSGVFIVATVYNNCNDDEYTSYYYYEQGCIFRSNNSGLTWSKVQQSTENWFAITTSESGQYMAAVSTYGFIYYSKDYGVSWTAATSTRQNWYCINSCRTSGQYVVSGVGITNGGLYYSSDYGVSWMLSDAPSSQWKSISSSYNGQYFVAVSYPKGMYFSSDFGETWMIMSTAPSSVSWRSVSMNYFGNHINAADGSYVYSASALVPTYSPTPQPTSKGIVGLLSIHYFINNISYTSASLEQIINYCQDSNTIKSKGLMTEKCYTTFNSAYDANILSFKLKIYSGDIIFLS